jgi:hypothetical protein
VGQGTGPGADRNLPAEALVHSCRLSETASSATRADVADHEGGGRQQETVLIRTMVEDSFLKTKLSLAVDAVSAVALGVISGIETAL